MAKRTNLITFDFSNVTEEGLKSLISAFKKAGQKLVEFSGNNRQKRKDGQLIKQAKFFFDSGQSVTLEINNTGDIVRAKVNSTVVPVTKLNSENALAKELAMIIDKGQEKFDKQLAKKAQKAIADNSDAKPISRSISKRIEEAKIANSLSIIAIDELKARKSTLMAKVATQAERETTLNGQIDTQKAKKNDLISQISEFGVLADV